MRLAFAAFLLALAACGPVDSPQSGSSPEVDARSASERPGETNTLRGTPVDNRLVEPGNALPAAPTAEIATALVELRGVASWYRYHPGQAAAGPRLRAFLGKDWRGTRVRVCTAICIWVTLTDWMKRDRLIDLDQRDFEWLAPASKGLVRVVVER